MEIILVIEKKIIYLKGLSCACKLNGEGGVIPVNEIKISTSPLRPRLLSESIIFRERGKRSSPDTIVPG